MYKKLLVAVVMFGLCAAASAQKQGQQPMQGVTISEWLKGLQKKIEQIVPKKSLPMTTAVAGVRGTKEEDQPKLYWKGKMGEEIITEEELARFKKAVDLAISGERDAALRELEDFMKQYPDSALIPDAKKTIDLVKADSR